VEQARISDAFLTLAQLAVAIAGFAGIILVFVERPEDLRGEDRIRIFQLLSASIGSMVMALVPYALELMRFHDRILWRLGSGVASAIQLLVLGIYLGLYSELRAEERRNLMGTTPGRFAISLVIITGTLGSLVLSLLNSTAIWLNGEQWAYFLVVLWGVTLSASYLLFIILIRPRRPE
jgi:MFS family permease